MSVLRERFARLIQQSMFFPRITTLVRDASGPWAAARLALIILQGLLPGAQIYLIRLLVDSFVTAIGSRQWQDIRAAFILGGLMAAVILLIEGVRLVLNYVVTIQTELLRDHITRLVHEQSTRVDLAFYETPDYFDHLHRARYEAGTRAVALLDGTSSFLQTAVTLITIAALLIPYGLWVPVVLVLSMAPMFVAVLRYRLREHEWRMRTTADERRLWYYYWLQTDREAAAEIRLFDLGGHFRRLYESLRLRLRDEQFALIRQHTLAQILATILGLLATGFVLLWMITRSLQGFLTLGDLALFYQAFDQGRRLTQNLLQQIGHLYANSLFLSNLFDFLDMTPEIIDPDHPAEMPRAIQSGIRFHKVTFAYPGVSEAVIEDFDLEIPANKTIAIVGTNGSGKSTLLKLICRLYDPDAGDILIDDVNLRDVPLSDLRKQIAVLFQEPVQYSDSVGQNITYGAVDDDPSPEALMAAAQEAGAAALINHLPQGLGTLLGKWFTNGHELSVGEWQRIALARTLVRQASIILLDEPTSSMDPWSSAAWADSLSKIFAGKTVLLITHQFSTAMVADLIYVMIDGQIVESGTHQELLALQGRYAQSIQHGLEQSAS